MSPNGISSGFGEILIFSSSDSSDSEFLLLEDANTRGNQINKQWEAIERTLYQEPGQQVTDPELLKECKLWRDTFPHFRVKGTKIEVGEAGKGAGGADKNVQTLENHFNLNVLEEKREGIKKKVVGALVDRLVAKFGSEKRESAKSERDNATGVLITEVDDDTAEEISRETADRLSDVEYFRIPSPVDIREESYFERGKPLDKRETSPKVLSLGKTEKKFYEIFNPWENEKTAIKLSKTALSANSKKLVSSSKDHLAVRNSEKSNRERGGPNPPRKAIPRSDSWTAIAKPFELTTKIDKKYEGLVERIMERQYNGFDGRRHGRTNSSGLEKSYQESSAKQRAKSDYDDHTTGRNMPRLNKFSNNWLDRSELNYHHLSAGDQALERTTKSSKSTKSFYAENANQREIDEKFLEELRREMASNYRRPPKKSGVIEEISLRRPKPFRSTPEATAKSSSFGDLTKRNKKEIKGGLSKKGFEIGTKESNVKSRAKLNTVSKGNKTNGVHNSLLPPIETGIICTELTGRPKIGPKNPSKRH